ncbi:MAG: SulP family inorganic anion transporter [Ideonella sp.]|nr:SulP family inorganic anion transporter [Ideonella sp.]MCC7457474.1 SulP family inorganic anion transporter [Nitrospira sp.]
MTLVQRLFGDWTGETTPQTLRHDALAGLLGAILVLPQAVAFAALAGLPPQMGLYSAIVPCVVAALFGSSRHVMSGPTNANSLALVAALGPLALASKVDYIELALLTTVLVGLLQCLVGGLRLGAIANFISPAALQGFTSGAALLIAVFGLQNMFGLPQGTHRSGNWLAAVIAQPIHTTALAVGIVTIVVTLLARRLAPRWPSMLLGLVAGTLLAQVVTRASAGASAGVQVDLLGPVAASLPPFHLPALPAARLPELLSALAPVVLALTILALGQSISIAKAVAERSGQRIDANREFIGQGLSNVVGGLFSCYVSCGSLNRSLPNYEAGAKTPLASVFAAVLLLALLWLAAPLVALLPMAAVGGLLIVVAALLLDLPAWRRTAAASRTDFWVALATAASMLVLRVETAILLGTGMSLVAYLYHTSRPAMRTMGFDTMAPHRRFVVRDDTSDALPECPHIKLLRMEGSVYFGAAAHVADTLHALREQPRAQKHLLVMAKSMNFIDAAGDAVWQRELRVRRAMGGDLYFHRPRPQVMRMWQRTGFLDALGRDHIHPDKRSAIAAIYDRLDPALCATCTARVTWECARRAAAQADG